jgi:Ca-activated chloride channel family protein
MLTTIPGTRPIDDPSIQMVRFQNTLRFLTAGSVLIMALLWAAGACAQAGVGDEAGYRLNLPVDEVVVTFHAADAHGLAVNDLKLDELRLKDNGRLPRKVLAFDLLRDAPIRVGILLDTSESMGLLMSGDRAIAVEYARAMFRQQTDQAFVMEFGYISTLDLDWTNRTEALAGTIGNLKIGKANPLGGTALFDALFRACYSKFGKIDHAVSGNFILLFSDGEDNASHTSLSEAVDMCQKANTAVYVFRPPNALGTFSTGPETLANLAAETGGRVFHWDDSAEEISEALRTIESELRNQYRLVYRPGEIPHDGRFHRIELEFPDRVRSMTVRSGYYAPRR